MGEIVCSNCGLVILDETLTRSPEWWAFTLEEKRSQRKVGAPTDYPRNGGDNLSQSLNCTLHPRAKHSSHSSRSKRDRGNHQKQKKRTNEKAQTSLNYGGE